MAWPDSNGDRTALATLESLPDAAVIESIWLRRSSERAQLEAARPILGDAVDSVTFYQSARHATYLADILGKRGTRLLHAHRSSAVLTAWLLKQLRPELKFSAAIEAEPSLPRGLLTRLLPSFDVISNSDARLNELLGKQHDDVLKLHAPFERSEVRIGPLAFKTKKAAAIIDRRAVEFAWLQRLREAIA